MNKIIKFHNERIKWLWILTAILAISFFAICFDNVKWIYTDDKGKWELLTSSLEKIIRLYSYNLIKDPTVNGVFYTTQIFSRAIIGVAFGLGFVGTMLIDYFIISKVAYIVKQKIKQSKKVGM
ncbi:conserved hypothetical protein [Ureaplasma parvum serovar 6 str. ATCC 27818]|uniref:hypothetical protein n=1 Tax=Ureaplasma parvum TaxID=134821 RepID=UPI000173BF21|nr:hypothetical protein [Ureaplasma parvum]EDU19199.1 conserved hypothetical protein [Ureaplasma parvum serovar 6 str. ATCC 27818]